MLFEVSSDLRSFSVILLLYILDLDRTDCSSYNLYTFAKKKKMPLKAQGKKSSIDRIFEVSVVFFLQNKEQNFLSAEEVFHRRSALIYIGAYIHLRNQSEA